FVDEEMRLHCEFLDTHLSRGDWFAGEFSAADIMMSYPVRALVARGERPAGEMKNLESFVARFEQRPARKRAVEKGGEDVPKR
ncbi:MAG: glutathione S-transferase, partial [Myxococcota bacterium]